MATPKKKLGQTDKLRAARVTIGNMLVDRMVGDWHFKWSHRETVAGSVSPNVLSPGAHGCVEISAPIAERLSADDLKNVVVELIRYAKLRRAHEVHFPLNSEAPSDEPVPLTENQAVT